LQWTASDRIFLARFLLSAVSKGGPLVTCVMHRYCAVASSSLGLRSTATSTLGTTPSLLTELSLAPSFMMTASDALLPRWSWNQNWRWSERACSESGERIDKEP
jgi:hypothetical protein